MSAPENPQAVALAPLVAVVASDERHVIETLACGHIVNNGLPLGRWANAPAKRRRCYKCLANLQGEK